MDFGVSLPAFTDELQKIAELENVEKARKFKVTSHSEFQSKLRTGDILFSSPDKSRYGLFDRFYKPISRKVQGTDFGHAVIYVGGGKIIDTKMGRVSEKRSLKSLVRGNNVVAVRPRATSREREGAVSYAHSTLGKKFSMGSILRAATPFRGKRTGKGPEEAHSLICSALVANAYAGKKFSDKSRLITRPSEILQSKLVKPIAALERFNS